MMSESFSLLLQILALNILKKPACQSNAYFNAMAVEKLY